MSSSLLLLCVIICRANTWSAIIFHRRMNGRKREAARSRNRCMNFIQFYCCIRLNSMQLAHKSIVRYKMYGMPFVIDTRWRWTFINTSEKNMKKKKKVHTSWVTGHKNPYNYFRSSVCLIFLSRRTHKHTHSTPNTHAYCMLCTLNQQIATKIDENKNKQTQPRTKGNESISIHAVTYGNSVQWVCCVYVCLPG